MNKIVSIVARSSLLRGVLAWRSGFYFFFNFFFFTILQGVKKKEKEVLIEDCAQKIITATYDVKAK